MITRKRQGFTIVELLVVISIIAMLMALLVPAVLLATAAARRTQCQNNMRNVGQALYTVATAKGYFPGRLSLMTDDAGNPMVDANGEPGVTWVTTILPNLEQETLLEHLRAIGTIQPPDTAVMYLPILICPSDTPAANNVPALSYVVNSGIQDFTVTDDTVPVDHKANGVFHDHRNPKTRSSLQVGLDLKDGASTTIMLSENVDAGYWNSLQELDHGLVWSADPDKQVRFNVALDERVPNDYTNYGFARPSSYHSNGVNVMFCGNNVRFQRDDIDYWVYFQLMTPDGRKAVIDPTTVPPTPAPLEFTGRLLSARDYE